MTLYALCIMAAPRWVTRRAASMLLRSDKCRARSENCVVVAEGELQHSGVFKASALGLPPVESRRTSEIAAKVLAGASQRELLKARSRGAPTVLSLIPVYADVAVAAESIRRRAPGRARDCARLLSPEQGFSPVYCSQLTLLSWQKHNVRWCAGPGLLRRPAAARGGRPARCGVGERERRRTHRDPGGPVARPPRHSAQAAVRP